MTELILAISLITTLILSYLERRDLNNRLMAKSLEDLRINTQKEEKNQIPQEEEELLTLEEAREEIEEQLNG